MAKYLDKDGVTTLWNKSKDTFAKKSHTHDFGTDITNRGEAFLTWGGKNIANGVSPVGSAMSSDHSANRLAFLNPNAIAIEYSDDGGTTWADLGVADSEKINLVTLTSSSISVGKSTTITTSSRLRITIAACDGTNTYFYNHPRKLLVNIGSIHGLTVTVQARFGSSSDKNWATFGTYELVGNSGWNDIPLGFGVLGAYNTSQEGNYWYLRLIFSVTSINSSNVYYIPRINALRMFGDQSWKETSSMGKYGHLYSFEYNQNAIFPAGVKATYFSENGTALSSKYLGIDATAKKSNKLVSPNYRPTSANFDHDYITNYVSQRLDISSTDMATGKPMFNGYITTYFWDNVGLYDTQLYIPCDTTTNNNIRPKIRYRNGSSWKDNWISIPYMSDIPTKLSQLENDSGYALTKDIPENTSDLTNDSNFISGNVVSNISSQYDEQDIPTTKFLEDYVANKVPSKTTTTIFDTITNVGTITGAGTTISKTITLTESVQAGDRLKVYVGGNTAYAQYNSAIIEFELFNPTSSTLGGAGTTMVYGASHGIVTARVQATSTTTTSLTVECWCLDASQYAAASVLNILKVERIR